MGAAWHAVAAPGVGKPEVLVRNTKGDLISLDAFGVGDGEQDPSARILKTNTPRRILC